ncbi:TNF receptor [Orthopoxvirus akhmetapox]|uniref:TNF receptor n=1 Tax=Orthopoxvirus akhmetapox TaxID=2200830 RepID=A0A5J6CT88_9POXV|nr:TNF receptor [Akhmeta virus]QEQ49762.1 TNF receptor [Akhmeta virus]QEQ49765.1 TNF receptor [Akhmeta virus]QEQ49975.1 TNF receptor [Akhmeta virus]
MKSVLYSYILFLSCIIINGRDIAPHAPSNGKCKANEYRSHNLCCLSCPPGTYASRLCDSETNTQCTPCGSDTFTSRNNHLQACLSCIGRCDSDQVETQSCNTTHNRICECSPEYYCLLKGSSGCRKCISKTKCGVGYGVSGYTPMGDVICSPCGLGTYSHTVSSVDKCEPGPRNTFNYIDVEIDLYPINDTSCTRTTTTGLSESISTSELTITMNNTDCDPVFRAEYFSVLNKVATSGFFTGENRYQNTSKICTLNFEIKCNNKDSSSKQLTKTKNDTIMPHSETVTLVGDCLSSIDVYILYSNTNTQDYETDTISYHVGNVLDVNSHMPGSCDIHKLINSQNPTHFL